MLQDSLARAEADHPEHWWQRHGFELTLAEEIPGFAGLFLEDEGRSAVVYLEDPETQASHATEVLTSGIIPEARYQSVRVLRATYALVDLLQWYDLFVANLRMKYGSDIPLTGVDPASNKILLGLRDETVQPALEPDLAGLGIPLGAITFEIVGEPVSGVARNVETPALSMFVPTLQNAATPYHPGYRSIVEWANSTTVGCTIGIFVGTDPLQAGGHSGFQSTATHCRHTT